MVEKKDIAPNKRRYIKLFMLLSVFVLLLSLTIVKSYALHDNISERMKSMMSADSMISCGNSEGALMTYIGIASQYHTYMDKWNKIVSTMAYSSESFVFSSVYDDSNRANICLTRALDIAKQTGEPTCVCSIFFNMGNYYSNYKDYVSASENYKAAFEIAESKHYNLKAGLAMSQLLNIAIENKDSSIFKILNRYLKLFGNDDPMSKYNRCIGNGLRNITNSNYREALNDFEVARSFIKDKSTRKGFDKLFEDAKQVGADKALDDYLTQIDFFKSRALAYNNNYDAAIQLLDSIAKNIGNKTDRHLVLNIYKQIESYCAEAGNTKLLTLYKQKYQNILNDYSKARSTDGYKKAIKLADRQDWQNENNDKIYVTDRVIFVSCIVLLIFMIIGTCLWTILSAINRKKKIKSEISNNEKYKKSNLDDKNKDEIYNKVMSVMNNSQEIYKTDFTLTQLATIIGVHERWVSQVINERCDKNFSALLNEFRVKEVCKRFSDDAYSNLTLGAIGESVGFSSRTYFAKVFKKIMSVSPSDYYKNVSNKA
jgi:AraC-like DNA-binding protein